MRVRRSVRTERAGLGRRGSRPRRTPACSRSRTASTRTWVTFDRELAHGIGVRRLVLAWRITACGCGGLEGHHAQDALLQDRIDAAGRGISYGGQIHAGARLQDGLD